jgi:ABC-type lipoprotein release transport system permease subunit
MGRDYAGVWYWARRELAQRWRALVVLGLLGGLAGGVAFAALAGARRTETVFDRWQDATLAPDAIVFATLVGVFPADYSKVRELPEVVAAGEFVLPYVDSKEIPGGTLAPADDQLYRTVAKPLVTDGRLPDPEREDEVLVNEAAVRAGFDVGDEITVTVPVDPESYFTGAESEMLEQRARIVGVGAGPMDRVFGNELPGFLPSWGFLAARPEVPLATNLVVRLRPGTSVAEFREHVVEAMGVPEMPVRDLAEDDKRITNGTDLERTGLLVFAAAALLAGLVLVGQAITRVVYAIAEARPALQAMGLTRGQLMLGLMTPLALTALVTVGVTVTVAILLSPLFPIGLAGTLEPDPGLDVDALVIGLGALAMLVLTLLIAAGGALRATARRRVSVDREPRVVRRVRQIAPLPVAIGAGLALERGRGERSLPVWPAIAGAVAAVVGVVGALGLLAGIDDALAERARSGQVLDLEIFMDEQISRRDGLQLARAAPEVDAIADQRHVSVDIGGSGTAGYSLASIRGDLRYELLEGRPPVGRDEIALGPATAKSLGVGPGDRVRVSGDHGAVRAHVVGIALLPQTAHSSFDQGGWMAPDGLAAIARVEARGAPDEAEVAEVSIGFTVRSGTDVDALALRMADQLGSTARVEPTSLPQDVMFLKNVRSLPRVLAFFLAFLGIAAVGHVLVTAVRRRRHDLAILRAVGFRPIQAAACIGWQATTVGVIGLVIGIPLGIVAGRLAWRWVADNTPLLYVGPIAVAAVLLIVPLTIVIANLLAALPARRAARIRPAAVLRTE